MSESRSPFKEKSLIHAFDGSAKRFHFKRSGSMRAAMGLLKQIFTWWDGATIGTALFTRRYGNRIGTDSLGNIYYQGKKDGRRWVIYNGANDVSRIPPEWYSWMNHHIDGHPDEALPPPPKFLKPATPNLTGTPQAYRPAGALERGGQRAAASGDYQAWTPD